MIITQLPAELESDMILVLSEWIQIIQTTNSIKGISCWHTWSNGMGKSTAFNILSGSIIQILAILKQMKFGGRRDFEFAKRKLRVSWWMLVNLVTVALKPQYVDHIQRLSKVKSDNYLIS